MSLGLKIWYPQNECMPSKKDLEPHNDMAYKINDYTTYTIGSGWNESTNTSFDNHLFYSFIITTIPAKQHILWT